MDGTAFGERVKCTRAVSCGTDSCPPRPAGHLLGTHTHPNVKLTHKMRPHHRCWSPHPHSKSTVKPGCRSGRQEHVPKEQRTNTTPCSAGRSTATLQDLAVVAPTGRAEFPMDRKRWRPGTVQTPGACHFICLQGLTYSNINRQRLLLVPLLSDRRGIPFCI